ncbi:MAG TPA: response regulator [Patescibacteria group bacterium]|nr:response regulator [Patescibacteria group bacterium]
MEPQNSTPSNNQKTVLVVEDDTSLQRILSEKISELGAKVVLAETAQDALNKINASPPNLILLDIMLPGGMNGFDVLEQIKRHPTLKTIHVIVLTNLDSEQKTALDIGAEDYIVKSNISLDEIVLKVKNQLQ